MIFGRAAYGVGIAGIGILHFFYPGFLPVILPLPTNETESINFIIYLLGGYLVISGISIAAGKFVHIISPILGFFLLSFLLCGHIPIRLQHHPEIQLYWIDAVKLLALSGGAFVCSHYYLRKPGKVAFLGKYMFAVMLIDFGIVHLLNAGIVSELVPKWIGFSLVWTYITGIALVGAGLAILLKIKVKLISLLLALMLSLWLMLLHLPATIQWKDAVNIVSSFECLAFCGIAVLIAFESDRKPVAEKDNEPL